MKTNLRNILLQSGCAVALIAGVAGSAQAQLPGIVNFGGTAITGGGGVGLNAKAWLPLIAGFGAYVEGGFQDHDPFGDIGFGTRFMLGNNLGIGGLLTFATQRGHDSHNYFYSIKPTVEVGLGNLTVGATFNVPVGKKEHTLSNSGSSQVELRNKPGTTTCTNPTNTDTKVCDLWLTGQEKSTEQNRFGVDLNAQYELSLGGFSVTPQVGVYVYDRQGKNLVGFHGGVELGLSLGNALSVNVGAGFRHDSKNSRYETEHRTQGVFTAGLTWHFGGTPASASTRFVDRAPIRTVYDRGVRSQTQQGKSFNERARLQDSTSNAPVAAVRFVDNTNQATAHTKISNLGQDEIVIVQGNVDLAINKNINMAQSHTALLGGNSNVAVVGVVTGNQGNFHTPGTRGVIRATGTTISLFTADNKQNVIIQGIDFIGRATTTRDITFTNNSTDFRIRDTSATLAANQALLIEMGSNNGLVSGFRATDAGQANTASVIGIASLDGITLENITIREIDADGFGFTLANVKNARVTNLDIEDNANTAGAGQLTSSHGIVINNGSSNITIDQVNIRDVGGDGIRIADATTSNIKLSNITITAGSIPGFSTDNGIWIRDGADNISLTNFTLNGRGTAGFSAVVVDAGSTNITFQNVHAENWAVGFQFLTTTANSIVDKGGNTFTPVGMQSACDGTDNSMVGGITPVITTTGLPTATPCR